MNAESGNDKKQEHTDIAERARELDQLDGITEKVVRQLARAVAYAVIEDDSHRCNTA